jgi:hypothetical protein
MYYRYKRGSFTEWFIILKLSKTFSSFLSAEADCLLKPIREADFLAAGYKFYFKTAARERRVQRDREREGRRARAG